MKRFRGLLLLLVISMPASAVENEQVMYVGGTVSALKEGVLGRLNTTSETAISFESAGNTLTIPYAKIESFEYSRQVARHLGVLPAIAVGLAKKRQRRHFFRISYRDGGNVSQVAIFEVPKQMPRILMAILQLRAPQSCSRQQCIAP